MSLMRHKFSFDFNVRDKHNDSYKFNFAIFSHIRLGSETSGGRAKQYEAA